MEVHDSPFSPGTPGLSHPVRRLDTRWITDTYIKLVASFRTRTTRPSHHVRRGGVVIRDAVEGHVYRYCQMAGAEGSAGADLRRETLDCPQRLQAIVQHTLLQKQMVQFATTQTHLQLFITELRDERKNRSQPTTYTTDHSAFMIVLLIWINLIQ